MTRGLGFYLLLGAWLIGTKMIAERIAHGLVTTHCSLRVTNGTGEMRSYKMGPSMRKAGLVLMALLGARRQRSPPVIPRLDRPCSRPIALPATRRSPVKTRSGHRSPALSVATAPRFQGTI